MKEHNRSYISIVALILLALMLAACGANDLGQDIPQLPSAENNVQNILPLVQDGVNSAENPTEDAYPVLADPDSLDTTTGDPQPAENPGSGEAETQPVEQSAETTEQSAEETAPEAPAEETPVEQQGPIVHIVQQAETIGTIAERYGVTIEDIAAANDLFNINIISIGQEIVIDPGAATRETEAAPQDNTAASDTAPVQGFDPNNYFLHTVAFGDTLFNIALRYGFTVEELAAYNGIADINRIDLNQQIRIPNR